MDANLEGKISAEQSRYLDRSLATELRSLKACAEELRLPAHVRETGYQIYKIAKTQRCFVKRDYYSSIVATLYAACRQNRLTMGLDEISTRADVDKFGVGRIYKTIIRTLELKSPAIEPYEYAQRRCKMLKVSQNCERRVLELIQKREAILSGFRPESIFAAALYVASQKCGEPLSQRETSKAAGVTEVTIRNTCHIFKD